MKNFQLDNSNRSTIWFPHNYRPTRAQIDAASRLAELTGARIHYETAVEAAELAEFLEDDDHEGGTK